MLYNTLLYPFAQKKLVGSQVEETCFAQGIRNSTQFMTDQHTSLLPMHCIATTLSSSHAQSMSMSMSNVMLVFSICICIVLMVLMALMVFMVFFGHCVQPPSTHCGCLQDTLATLA
jgi:hypothetical protein